MTDTKQIRVITLNLDQVVAPLFNELKECTNSILFGLQTMEMVNEIPPDLEIKDGFFRLQYGDDVQDIETKKENYQNWLLRKGFEDLIKGIEASLREAFIYVSVLSKATQIQPGEDIEQSIAQIRKKAQRMHIPDMIKKIEPHLAKSWSYKKQIISINQGRNCLVHRRGFVSEKDINDRIENTLKIDLVKLKFFYEKDDKEIEIIGKTTINGGTEGTIIKLRREDNTISFKQGERISLNYRQFNESIVTCYHFGTDLVDCLPKPGNGELLCCPPPKLEGDGV
jgi:hypothetical protein